MEPQRVFTLRAALKCWVEWERVHWWMLVESPGGEEEQLSVESARAHYSSRGTSFEQHVHVLKPENHGTEKTFNCATSLTLRQVGG